MSDALEVRVKVSAARRVHIDVDFEIAPGVTALFGASGVGKSTLLLVLAGLFQPDAGRIRLGQRVLFDTQARVNMPPERRRTALVFQSLALFPHLTVLENAAYGIPRDVSSAERLQRAKGWLARMRVEHVAERKPPTLSGGEAQRVALARALASEPRALLLDEPLSALDEALSARLGEELRELTRELALPTLLVTHDRSDAQLLAARALVMREGRVEPATF